MKPDAWKRKIEDTQVANNPLRVWNNVTQDKVLHDDEPLYSAATVRKWLEEEPSLAMIDASLTSTTSTAWEAIIAAKLRELEGGNG